MPQHSWRPLTTHSGRRHHERWLAECLKAADGAPRVDGWIDPVTELYGPGYGAWAPRWPVYTWRSRLVFWREVSDRAYAVYQVPKGMPVHRAMIDGD